MPTALVTGITGQDGGYLAERLLADGYDVHGLVHHGDAQVAQEHLQAPGITLHPGDLADEQALAGLVRDTAPDEIYNLGGISSVAFSWEHPVLTGDISGLAVGRLLETVRRHADSTGRDVRFLQASSAEIFGDADHSPQDESTPVRPVSPYGAAKAYAHHLVGVYRTRGMHASAVILYNHESPRRPVQFVTRKITRTVAEISLGRADELVLGNLDARRDWGWAPDYVDAMVRAARHGSAGDYIVATGRISSVADFVGAAFAHVGIADWQSFVRTDPRFVRPTDTADQVGDPSKVGRVLGWKPTLQFRDIVARMVDHDLRDLGRVQDVDTQTTA